MDKRFKNPHTFDMSNYYFGMVHAVGGRDFEREEKEAVRQEDLDKKKEKNAFELDWSFLKSVTRSRRY
jgi:hypothetical protein